MTNPDPPRTVAVYSPNKPRPAQADIRFVADTLRHVEINYLREGSGPGSRFEGLLLEDVQAATVLRLFAAKLLSLAPGTERVELLREIGEIHDQS